jgi:drug/metabolite transporter (DMT)-like permease
LSYSHTLGLTAGLLAAFSWAVAAVIFRQLGVRLHPLVLNLYKGVIASVALVLVLTIWGGVLQPVPLKPFLLLLFSGMLGIGVGDSAFFAALNRLGERQTVLIAETVAPLITIMLALLLFQEFISLPAWLGIIAILSGVYLVIRGRSNSSGPPQKHLLAGVTYGLVAAICQAVGGIMSKGAFRLYDIDPVWSSLVRLLGGLLLVAVLIPLLRQNYFPVSARSKRVWRFVLLATLIGTFGGIIFQQTAYKFTYTGLAQTMIATSSIFVMLIALVKGERISPRAWLGAMVAVAGVVLLFWF